MQSSMTRLTFEFTATECDGWPKIHIYIDDDHYETFEVSEHREKVTIPFDLLDGQHEVEIQLFGKSERSTVLDGSGKIVRDQILTLEDIYVDDIKIPRFFMYEGRYYDVPEGRQALTWGMNNVSWKWCFETPLIGWVVHRMNAKTDETAGDDLNMYSDKKVEELTALLNELEGKIDELDV